MAINSEQQGLSTWEWSVNGQVEGQIEAETYTIEYQEDCTDFSGLPGKNILTYASRGFYTFNFSRWATPPHSLGKVSYVDLELEKLVISSEDQEIYYYPTGGKVYRSKVYYHLFREGCTVETVEGDTGANNGIIYKPKNPQFGGLWRLDFLTEDNRIARYEYQQQPTVQQLAGEGYYCPLLEDECITVKHIIQEELNNARLITYRKDRLNDLPILEAAYANLDPEIYYESPRSLSGLWKAEVNYAKVPLFRRDWEKAHQQQIYQN